MADRLTPLHLRPGLQQIGEAFGFHQIHPAIGEGPSGEFARLRRPYPVEFREGRIERRHYRLAAMDMELRHILAGDSFGSRHP